MMIQNENLQLNIVVIYVWRGKAYIPTQAQFESGIFVGVEPLYVVPLDTEELIHAMQSVKDAGHTRFPNPKTREEFKKRKDPVLAATNARSWKQLARNGASYTVGWTKNEIRIDMSRLDKEGRWENDPSKVKLLPSVTPLDNIVEIILEDIKTRPEVFH